MLFFTFSANLARAQYVPNSDINWCTIFLLLYLCMNEIIVFTLCKVVENMQSLLVYFALILLNIFLICWQQITVHKWDWCSVSLVFNLFFFFFSPVVRNSNFYHRWYYFSYHYTFHFWHYLTPIFLNSFFLKFIINHIFNGTYNFYQFFFYTFHQLLSEFTKKFIFS